jgi:hypothetical protein
MGALGLGMGVTSHCGLFYDKFGFFIIRHNVFFLLMTTSECNVILNFRD